MRLLVGVAVEDRVIEMALPADVPLAHLLADVRAAVAEELRQKETVRLMPRLVDGTWLDLERSLSQQAGAVGGLICLERRETRGLVRHHDPVTEIADRGPPVELLPDTAATVAVGALGGVLLAVYGGSTAAVAVLAGAPAFWALLPMLGGIANVASAALVRRLLSMVSVAVGAAAVAVSGIVAWTGRAGSGLAACLGVVVLVHVSRRSLRNALLRVTLTALEWLSLAAVLPLAALSAGWSG
ncbi:hypothetical protein Back2_19450 [Nocardioides baekrokdamisoli]|uniref:Uncharacterized protein n=1 Tax=Nocardioides baekrokdamisoli TaxID=1804624 RepID=A0A3G9J263_9ACTN|nr:EsaB/YukD family protein [Nocardioides baekrokdamisoli]BBH17658.1 hypothetical protein Back2_19450 [Nocardioides baekrokdamisoli]